MFVIKKEVTRYNTRGELVTFVRYLKNNGNLTDYIYDSKKWKTRKGAENNLPNNNEYGDVNDKDYIKYHYEVVEIN